jgi:NTE family protein
VKPERVVLVLSGGGMKAMAHVGVVRALADVGIQPSTICAVSAGAMVGAMVAGGMPYDDLAAVCCALGPRGFAVLNRPQLLLRGVGAAGVLRGAPLRRTLARILPEQSFEHLRIPLRVGVADLDRGEMEVFGSMGRTDWSVAQAVYASMALPLYLPPAVVAGHTYADGGVLEVLPLGLVPPDEADLVIAVDVGPSLTARTNWRRIGPRLVALHDRVFAIQAADKRERMIAAWEGDAARAPLVLVRPAVDPSGTFAFDRTVDFIEAGYRAAHAALAARITA